MDIASGILNWTYHAIATWYLAAVLGGVLIFTAERLARRAGSSDADVKRAAKRYLDWYGSAALCVIGDHILAASFAPDSRHRQFLKRVVGELQGYVGHRNKLVVWIERNESDGSVNDGFR